MLTAINKSGSKTTEQKKYLLLSLFISVAIDAMSVGLVWPLFSIIFFNDTTSILPNDTSVFMRNLLYGITISISPICTFFGSAYLGDLSDYKGRKPVLLLCSYGTFLGYVLCIISLNIFSVYLLILGRALIGFCVGSQPIAQAVIVDISPLEKKTARLSIISLANNFGFILGPLIGVILINSDFVGWFNLNTPFMVSAFLTFLNSFLLYIFFKETYHYTKIKRIHFFKNILALIHAFTDKKIRHVLTIYFFAQLALSIYLQYSLINLIKSYKYGSVQISYFLSLYFLVFSLSLILIMPFLLRHSKSEKIINFTLFGSILSFLMASFNIEFFLWLSVFLGVSCSAITYNCLLTIFSNSVSREIQGKTMGIAGSIQAICSCSSPLISIGVEPIHPSFPFLLASFLVALAFLIALSKGNNLYER